MGDTLVSIFERDLPASDPQVSRTTFQGTGDFEVHATIHHLYSAGVCVWCNV